MSKSKDLDLLRALADFRLATTPLLAARLDTSEQMIRRRCKDMIGSGSIQGLPRGLGQGRGRPEWVYSVSSEGAQKLKAAKLLSADVPSEKVISQKLERLVEHQLLLNELAVKFFAIENLEQDLSVKFISSTSPFHLSNSGGTILYDQVEFPDGTQIPLIPDAACCITHKGLKKSLLFFLEVDRGTEVVVTSKDTINTDLRRKIIVYRTYFVRQGYKRYESGNLFNIPLDGFRLLLVAPTRPRREVLCRLVRAMQPSNFVWVADETQIACEGLGNAVWSVGGESTISSLLGSHAEQAEQTEACQREQ